MGIDLQKIIEEDAQKKTILGVLYMMKDMYTISLSERFLGRDQHKHEATYNGLCACLFKLHLDSKTDHEVFLILKKAYFHKYGTTPSIYEHWFKMGLLKPRLELIKIAIKMVEKK